MGALNGSAMPGGSEPFGRGDVTPHNGHVVRPADTSRADGVADQTSSAGPLDAADALDAERARLEAEIAEAVARKEAATRSEEDTNAALHAVVLRMKARLAEMEERHVDALTAIRAAGEAEIARITADAERRASRDVHPATTPVEPWNGGVS